MHRTPLYDFHREHNARLVDFAGWEMPVVYTGIVEEHHHTRRQASLFDVSHMGRVEFRGGGALPLLEKLNTRNIGSMSVGQCRYSHMCRGDGGILDDVIVSRLEDHYLVVCNASNREKLLAWWQEQRSGFDVQIEDRTFETAMIAIQGPDVLPLLDQVLPFKVSELKRYHFRTGEALGAQYYVARSGYTGEDGIEIIIPANLAMTAMTMLVNQSAGMERPVKPAGLGARDTLRLEAAMPLYGHELTEEWDSLTAGQGWCVDLSKEFIGADVLRRIKAEGPRRQIVGFELSGRRIARQGAALLAAGGAGSKAIGTVTSGTLSPTFDKVIGLALVESPSAAPGTEVLADMKGTQVGAKIVATPFYRRPK